MDFGKILEKWERSNSGKSVMNTWLQKNDVINKDADLHEESSPGIKRRRMLNKKPDAIIDIHGLTSEKAWLSLELFFENAANEGFEKVLVIHGKGNRSQGEAVLKIMVQKFIEQCKFAGESGFEKAANGGSGATWVLVKNK